MAASETSNTKYLELLEIRSKVQEKNMSCERALNFDQWKLFSENYKPMRVWLWLVYKFTKNCQIYRQMHCQILRLSYLSWQNMYPNLETTCHIKLNFFLSHLTPKELTPCKKSHICHCSFKAFMGVLLSCFCFFNLFV